MGKKKSRDASTELTEDEMLKQAIAENKAAADEIASAAAAGIRPLTQKELIAKLDQVLLLNLVATTDDQKKQIVPGADGSLRWYSDVFDAKVALRDMEAKMPPLPGYALGLNFTPLGKAYSLSEGWVKVGSGEAPPMCLQPSSKVLQEVGEASLKALDGQLPSQLKKRNRRQGAFPIFYLEELVSERTMPFFFTRDDLVTCWMSSGKSFEDLPKQLNVIDLRVLVVRVLTEPNRWLERLTFVPPQSSVDLMQMVDGISDQLEALGNMAAKATGEAIAEANAAHQAAIASGEEPPALA